MSDRHLKRPGNAGPKSQRGEERGGEAQVVFDKEGTDDAGEAGNPVGHVDHEGRQIGEPHLTSEGKQVAVDPLSKTCEHYYDTTLMVCRRSTSACSCARISWAGKCVRSPCPANTHSKE